MSPKDQPFSRSFTDSYRSISDEHSEMSDNKTEKKLDEFEFEESAGPTNEYVLNVAFYSFIGFLAFQAVFALIAGSKSMLADSEAMTVDALTYLFNLVAERVKNRPYSALELELPKHVRSYRRELQRLYLELIPPSISVLTLFVVTMYTLRESFMDLFEREESEEDVSVNIMVLFSGLNLMLDVVNVTCFARAQSAFGLDGAQMSKEKHRMMETRSSTISEGASESTSLLSSRGNDSAEFCDEEAICLVDDETQTTAIKNMNMCSAWTHICADTLRSFTVLLASTLAFFIPSIDGNLADSVGAIVVSVIILASIIPLVKGLIVTIGELRALLRNPPLECIEV